MLQLLSKITVEPVLLMFMLPAFMQYGVFQDLVYQKVCFEKLNDLVLCNNRSMDKPTLAAIQTETSHWIKWSTVCLTVPSLIMASYLGSWGDKWGRKTPMLLPTIGGVLSSIIYVLTSMSPSSSIGYILVASFVSGIFGGFVSLIMSVMSYMGEVTENNERTTRVSRLEAMTFLGASLGPFLGGILVSEFSHTAAFILITGVYATNVVYIMLRIKSRRTIRQSYTVSAQTYNDSSSGIAEPPSVTFKEIFSLRHVFESITTCFRKREDGKRGFLLAGIICILAVLFASAAEQDLSFLYLADIPFKWSFRQYSNYTATLAGSRSLVLLMLMPLVRYMFKFSDTILATIGIMSKGASLVLLAFSTSSTMVYLVPLVGIFSAFPAPSIRSLLSKLVKPDEQGKMFAFVSIVQNFVTLFAALVYNNIYPLTREVFKGLCFIGAAAFLLIPVALLCWIRIKSRSTDMNRSNAVTDQRSGEMKELVAMCNVHSKARLKMQDIA